MLGIEGVAVVLVMYGPVRWTVTASSIYLLHHRHAPCAAEGPWRMMRWLSTPTGPGYSAKWDPFYQFRHARLQNRLAHTYRRRT